MAQVLRQSTAVDVLIGPFVDSTDGTTALDALTLSQADIQLSKNGQTMAQKNDATAATHDAEGMYNCELDATDTNTVGQLDLIVAEAGALIVVHRYQVITAEAYDAIYGTPSTLLTSDDVGLLYESDITTVTGQTEFIMTETIASDDIYVGQVVLLVDVSVPTNKTVRYITDLVQGTETIHINAAPSWTVVAGDRLRVYADVHPRFAMDAALDEFDTSGVASHAYVLKLAKLLARSDAAVAADEAATLTEINEDAGSGVGDYDNTTDSLEAAQAAQLAIKAKTDSLTFTVAGEVDSNAVSMNDAEILGAGTAADKWRGEA